jgi:enoyl-CoA hydratase
MGEHPPLKIETDHHIAWLILNRPEKRNAMGLSFFDDMVTHFDALDKDPNVRVVIVKAAGDCFSAGIDLDEAGSIIGDGAADSRDLLKRKIQSIQESTNVIERCRKPVIAAVHGPCIGGGVDVLSACDIRIASKDAVFGIRETQIGIVADLGTLQRMPYIIGYGRFTELALTGRNFTAGEALDMGFITQICEDKDALNAAALALAEDIAALPPLTVQGVKEVILYSRDNGVYPGLSYVAQKNAAALPSEDLFEAVGAFMEKRKPVFKGK